MSGSEFKLLRKIYALILTSTLSYGKTAKQACILTHRIIWRELKFIIKRIVVYVENSVNLAIHNPWIFSTLSDILYIIIKLTNICGFLF